MNRIFYNIKRFEKAHLKRSTRKSMWYLILKLIVLFPLVILNLLHRGLLALSRSTSKAQIVRADKPPIVLANIVSGFANLTFPDEQAEALAMKRANICALCPAAQKTGIYSVVVDKRTKQIQGMKCGDCGCNLSAKVRSIHDSCPRGKW